MIAPTRVFRLCAARPGSIAAPLIVGAALSTGLTPTGVFYLLAVPMAVLAVMILLVGLRYGHADRPTVTSFAGRSVAGHA